MRALFIYHGRGKGKRPTPSLNYALHLAAPAAAAAVLHPPPTPGSSVRMALQTETRPSACMFRERPGRVPLHSSPRPMDTRDTSCEHFRRARTSDSIVQPLCRWTHSFPEHLLAPLPMTRYFPHTSRLSASPPCSRPMKAASRVSRTPPSLKAPWPSPSLIIIVRLLLVIRLLEPGDEGRGRLADGPAQLLLGALVVPGKERLLVVQQVVVVEELEQGGRLLE